MGRFSGRLLALLSAPVVLLVLYACTSGGHAPPPPPCDSPDCRVGPFLPIGGGTSAPNDANVLDVEELDVGPPPFDGNFDADTTPRVDVSTLDFAI